MTAVATKPNNTSAQRSAGIGAGRGGTAFPSATRTERHEAGSDFAITADHEIGLDWPLPGMVCGQLSFEVVPGDEQGAILPEWRKLEQTLQSRRMNCSAAWVETWLGTYGSNIPHDVLIARRGGVVRGICLLTRGIEQKIGPFTLPTRHLGTAGEPEEDSAVVEYNAVLVHPDDRRAFFTYILEYLHAQKDWLEFRLDGFAEADIADLLAIEPRFEIVRKRAFYFDLAAHRATGQSLVDRYSKQTRRTLRRNFKIYDDLKVEWAETVAHADDIFTDMVVLHQERWNARGKPGVYASRWFYNFHRDLLRRLVPEGRMAMVRVKHGDHLVGCTQLLVDDRRLLVYQGGHAPYDVKHSPGLVTDFCAIEESARRGFDAYDFMAGDIYHKQRLTNCEGELLWATLRRPSWKFQVVKSYRKFRSLFHRHPSGVASEQGAGPEGDSNDE